MKRRLPLAWWALLIPALLVVPVTRQSPADEPKQDKPPGHAHDPVVVEGGPIITQITVELKRPRRLLFDLDGNLLIADSATGKVLRRTPEGKTETIAEGLDQPSGLALDRAGNLYVSTHAGGGEEKGTVLKVSPQGRQTVLAKGLTGPKGLAFDANGNLFVANFDANTIVRIDPEGKVAPFARDVPTPAGLVFDKEGNLYAVNSAAGTVSKITPTGEVSELAKGFAVPSDIAMSADGHLIVTNYGGTELSQVDLKGKVTPYAAVPEGTIGLVFDPEGNLLLVNWDHQLLFKRTVNLSIPCPHCQQKIPVRLKPGEPPRKRGDI